MMLADICQTLACLTICLSREIASACGFSFPCFLSNITTIFSTSCYISIFCIRGLQLMTAFSGSSKLYPEKVQQIRSLTWASFSALFCLIAFVIINEGIGRMICPCLDM